MKNLKRKGFTLVELVIVVIIIGILTLIALPRFANMTSGANIAMFESNHRILASAVMMYASQTAGAMDDFTGIDGDIDDENGIGPFLTQETWDMFTGTQRPDGAVYEVEAGTGVVTSTYTPPSGPRAGEEIELSYTP